MQNSFYFFSKRKLKHIFIFVKKRIQCHLNHEHQIGNRKIEIHNSKRIYLGLKIN